MGDVMKQERNLNVMYGAMRKKILWLVLLVVVSLNVLYHFGRPLWRPYYLKWTGKDTVADILSRYEDQVNQRLSQDLKRLGVEGYPDRLMIIAIKESQQLEMWGEYEGSFRLIKIYPFTGFCGVLGPKLERGDGQIPEGLYGIEYLNPNSRFHLSMKITYPNQFDREMGENDGRSDLGDDIMIHGKTATIGCIPIGDEGIEEVFIWVARVGREKTGVMISPVDFRQEGHQSPTIDGVDWEPGLYREIRAGLLKFRP